MNFSAEKDCLSLLIERLLEKEYFLGKYGKHLSKEYPKYLDKSINRLQAGVKLILEKNLNAKEFLIESLDKIYSKSLNSFCEKGEFNKNNFPKECLWTFEEIMKE